ncbi:related to U3 small nucleolar RNA-associated protein 14 [Saccharomycodes ludwigii]|uniref:Related to U3 small nucleolar RNA-associated protein 14 n=1 Tax=Saccharomycodes ludwigii TaxID=36035 RepID=A0A376B6I2_9ASCO|nr:related to U3 small nucleolar RNA-associated protein 14 [Saccharomycodes ludwigii]
MAKKRTKPTKKQTSRRSLNAFELAEREINGNESDSFTPHYKNKKDYLRLNGTIVNPNKLHNDDSDNIDDSDDDFEDEELDSDEALNSEDDYDVLNSKFSQTIRDKNNNELTLGNQEEEEEGGYTSIDEEELMPLSKVWDINVNNPKESAGDNSSSEDDSALELDDRDEEDADSESEKDADSESEEVNDDIHSDDPFDEVSDDDEEVNLNTVTSKLNKENDKSSNLFKKLDTYADGEENEFALPGISSSGLFNTSADNNTSSGKKLKLTDLLSVVDDKKALDKATLLKEAPKPMAVPLPQRIQKRHERKIAYELSKDEVNKWKDTVQQNRRADHLSFPLVSKSHPVEASTFTPVEKPVTELEEKVGKMLKDSNLVEITKRESKFEDIATATMSPEEMKKRTTELRLMRSLMFREERKARRIKKIKSKAYHRVKKKEMLRNKALISEDADQDSDEEASEKHDIQRAKERMTLKHKTTSKWAQDMIKHGMTKDQSTREEMEEMLAQSERLKSKILGHGSDDSDEGDTFNGNLSDLERENDDANAKTSSNSQAHVGKSGVLNMAFMKNAEAREKKKNQEMLGELRNLENGDDTELFKSGAKDMGANIILNQGRRVYTPAASDSNINIKEHDKRVLEENEMDGSRDIVKRVKDRHDKKIKERNNSKPVKAVDKNENENEFVNKVIGNANPWLNEDSDNEGYSGQKTGKVNVVDENSSKQSKMENKINKNKAKHARKSKNKNHANEDLILNLDAGSTLNIVDPYGGSEDEQVAFQQQNVIAEAFAGDDVVSNFEEEKKRVAIDEDDKEVDVTLPGWGEWAGSGTNKHKKRKYIKKVKGLVNKEKRRDKNLKNVIINEKVNKKNLKYQSSAVPFPYESKEQYERSLRMPIGQEWASSNTYSKMIKPRIMTKPGVVIDPLKEPFK